MGKMGGVCASRTTSRVTSNVALVDLAPTRLAGVDGVLVRCHARAEEEVLAHAAVGTQNVLELRHSRALGALRGGGASHDARIGLVSPAPRTGLKKFISRVGRSTIWGGGAVPVAAGKYTRGKGWTSRGVEYGLGSITNLQKSPNRVPLVALPRHGVPSSPIHGLGASVAE